MGIRKNRGMAKDESQIISDIKFYIDTGCFDQSEEMLTDWENSLKHATPSEIYKAKLIDEVIENLLNKNDEANPQDNDDKLLLTRNNKK
jgi:hypothetical protein